MERIELIEDGLAVELGPVVELKGKKTSWAKPSKSTIHPNYVVVYLYDHNKVHGEVKAIPVFNVSKPMLVELRVVKNWKVEKRQVTLILEDGTSVVRRFRSVYFVGLGRKVEMTNEIDVQVKNLKANARVQGQVVVDYVIGPLVKEEE